MLDLSIEKAKGTPYWVIRDINGAPILTIAINPKGYILHPAHGVQVGDRLVGTYPNG